MPADRDRHGLHGELKQLFAKAKMPTSPALAARILELINDARSNAVDFAAIIRIDPALSARLLKTANSAQFAQRTAVTTIERAVMVLGLNRVKTISLGFQLVGHLDHLGGAPFDMTTFWQHSLLRACLARSIAQRVVPACKEEAFLVGLLQECGVLLLVQILGSGYASLYRSNLSPAAFFTVEREEFPHTHVDAISVVASEWALPGIIAVPLERHHCRPSSGLFSSEIERLSAVSCYVGGLCFVSDRTVAPEEQSLREFGAKTLGLDDEKWAQVRRWAADEYRQISMLYGDVLPQEVDVAELLSEANRQLASVVNDADQRVLNVEAEREAIHREQQRLANALSEYRERAALDPLTHVLNRGALSDAVRKAIERNLDDGEPVGILFLDIDNFKKLNDTYGHKVGDHVLKAAASLLDRETAPAGTVGRYGGEEFVVLLRGLSAQATHETAERIVRQFRTLDEEVLTFPGTVTCSVGAIWCERVPTNSAEDLFATADQLMYKAKRGGKDRCCLDLLSGGRRTQAVESPTTRGRRSFQESRAANRARAGEVSIEKLLACARDLNSEEVDALAGIRKEERKTLVVPCVLHYFTGRGMATRSEDAVTRNISTGGMALVLARPMVRGEAVEVVVDKSGSQIFLGGLVTFCRRVDGGIHEIGVQFVTQSVTPIISGDTLPAADQQQWVAEALLTKYDGGLETQEAPPQESGRDVRRFS